MIKRKSDQVSEVRKNMRSGSGEVKIRHYLNNDEIDAPCRFCAELTLGPGCSIGLHQHSGEEEIFIIQQGTATIIDNDKEIAVASGDVILTANGASHAVKNTGGDSLVITALIIQYNQ